MFYYFIWGGFLGSALKIYNLSRYIKNYQDRLFKFEQKINDELLYIAETQEKLLKDIERFNISPNSFPKSDDTIREFIENILNKRTYAIEKAKKIHKKDEDNIY